MKNSRLAAIGLTGAWLMACGGAPPPPKARTVHDQPPEPRLSAEWIYVTQSPGLDQKPECERVHDYVLGESGCQSTVCSHGAALARDWQARCRSRAEPSVVLEVERLRNQYLGRASESEDACAAKIEGWLAKGCGKGGACQDAVSSWGTRCGKAIGSPLALMMLEKSIEQSLPDPQPVTVDVRTCDDLSRELLAAAACEQQFKCEDALPKIDFYRQRCASSVGGPLGIVESIAELALRLGANQSPGPMPIAAEPRELSPEQHKLVLVGKSGAILRVCSKPVLELGAYLAQRRSCMQGEVVTVQAFGDASDRVLRVGTFTHPSDQAFLGRFPSLVAVGEGEVRARAAAEALAVALGPIADRGQSSDSIGAFCRALGGAGAWLGNSEAATQLVAGKDASLEKLLVAIGSKKAHYAAENLKGKQRSGVIARAWTLVCADLDAAGMVSPGATNPGSMVELARALPRAVAAYRAELQTLSAELDKAPADRREERATLAALRSRGQACDAALARAAKAEQILRDCAYGNELCDAEERHQLGQRLDQARSEIESARRSILLGVFSLPRAQQAAARDQVSAESACLR